MDPKSMLFQRHPFDHCEYKLLQKEFQKKFKLMDGHTKLGSRSPKMFEPKP